MSIFDTINALSLQPFANANSANFANPELQISRISNFSFSKPTENKKTGHEEVGNLVSFNLFGTRNQKDFIEIANAKTANRAKDDPQISRISFSKAEQDAMQTFALLWMKDGQRLRDGLPCLRPEGVMLYRTLPDARLGGAKLMIDALEKAGLIAHAARSNDLIVTCDAWAGELLEGLS